MTRLSVLLPVRDAQPTIAHTVRSLLRRLPPSSELVVLDNASSDRTVAELARIDDGRLRVHYSAWPLTPARALTHLLQVTDSPVVARADLRYRALPGRFRLELEALRRHDVVVGGVARRGRVLAALRTPPLASEEFPLALLRGDPAGHPSLLARRSALELAGGYRDGENLDYDLLLRLAASGARIRRLGKVTLVTSAPETPAPEVSELDAPARESYERLAALVDPGARSRPVPR